VTPVRYHEAAEAEVRFGAKTDLSEEIISVQTLVPRIAAGAAIDKSANPAPQN
jgi:hypothetical protein